MMIRPRARAAFGGHVPFSRETPLTKLEPGKKHSPGAAGEGSPGLIFQNPASRTRTPLVPVQGCGSVILNATPPALTLGLNRPGVQYTNSLV